MGPPVRRGQVATHEGKVAEALVPAVVDSDVPDHDVVLATQPQSDACGEPHELSPLPLPPQRRGPQQPVLSTTKRRKGMKSRGEICR